jgi:hypothetical protein
MNVRRRIVAAMVVFCFANAFAQQTGSHARSPRLLKITMRNERPPQIAEGVQKQHGAVITDSRSASAYESGKDSLTTRTQSSELTVLVRDGARTLIQFEAAVPMTFSHYAIGNGSVEEVRGEVSYNALVEFAVSPRLAGNAVTLRAAGLASGYPWVVPTCARRRASLDRNPVRFAPRRDLPPINAASG